jgi:4'-phosphopantetheinyl transferase
MSRIVCRSLQFRSMSVPAHAQVWCIDLTGVNRTGCEAASRILSDDERQRAARFAFPELSQKFTLARAVLRRLIANFSNTDPAALLFNYGPQGKPFITHLEQPIQFSVSHSGDLAAYVITGGQDVGIDIEKHRGIPDFEDIAKRFFCRAEYDELLSLAPVHREEAFLQYWVRKEAYIKAVGEGLSIDPSSFRVSPLSQHPTAVLEVFDRSSESSRWAIHGFTPMDNYCGAVAVRDPQCAVEFRPLSSAGDFFRD